MRCVSHAVLLGPPPAPAAPFLAFCIFQSYLVFPFYQQFFFLLFSDAHQAFKIIIYLIDAHLLLSALYHSVPQSLPFILTFETKDGYLCLYVMSVQTHAE